MKRKAMNSFFCSISRLFKFIGRMNDDVNTYVVLGNRGNLLFTIPTIRIEQNDTQQSSGGLTDMYLRFGTYIKSFYSVMFAPSCVKVHPMTGNIEDRLHHRISWNNAVPKIMNEQYCKRLTQPTESE